MSCADDWLDEQQPDDVDAPDEEPELTPAQLQQIRDLVRYGRPVDDHPGIDQYQP